MGFISLQDVYFSLQSKKKKFFFDKSLSAEVQDIITHSSKAK